MLSAAACGCYRRVGSQVFGSRHHSLLHVVANTSGASAIRTTGQTRYAHAHAHPPYAVAERRDDGSFGVHAITTAGSYDIASIRSHLNHIQRERERERALHASASADSSTSSANGSRSTNGTSNSAAPWQHEHSIRDTNQHHEQLAPCYTIHELPKDLANSALLVSVQHPAPHQPEASGDTEPGSHLPTQQQQHQQQGAVLAPSTVLNKAFILSSGSIVFWSMTRADMRMVRELCRIGEMHPIKDEQVIEQEHEILSYRITTGKSSTIERGTIFLSTAHRQQPGTTPTSSDTSSSSADEVEEQQDASQLQPVHLDMFAFSHALANSVELGILETELNAYSRNVESIPEAIKDGTKLRLTRSYVLQRYGELLTLRHKLNTSKDLSNFYWDREQLEALYDRTCAFLDVTSRRRLCNERLNYHSELAELLRITLSEQHSTKLEWYIIGLIAVEVMFELYHVFMR
ncbi:hypothetical protein PTSG_02181 [Salpingoeca rosetta]|uniref:DUF155 domain-containing protein n=1 Tax=Salpingoeca rosetta (strain ATCC 50818 / BSB-021) TaxID=946362 RepID=F2U1G1_SALR5|nr:uncharacterized protein PTSG_02181 [Salpingoeca rosetta]EGD81463.1 hypothetical protein PTSG_02181 [Salpingoeca rosetta]|eukprot:XP_004996667.1 hypothetical protein PTSG_02181 [Salpingoeca rosetta]